MMRRLSILYVAYPLLEVTEESAGGAEQMLLAVERELNAQGHRTKVAAAEGSHVCGRLLATGAPASAPNRFEQREQEQTDRILDYLHSHADEFDLIHDKSGGFFRYAAECPVPVLATLHLPLSFYKQQWFSATAKVSGEPNAAKLGHSFHADNPSISSGQALGHQPHPLNLYFNCVSQSQAQSFAGLPNMLGVVQNGIAIEQFPIGCDKSDYVLWLGRICEEKAPHLAIATAQRADASLILAGQVYPFRYHLDYFEREIRPHLDGRVRFVDTPLASQKLDLLRHARALLLTSTVTETSSLVAMEAMACGTPVIALRRGAFPEIVADGETGFVTDSIDEMAAALGGVDLISPEKCRMRVERHFRSSRMAQEYKKLYEQVLDSAEESAA